LLSKLFRDVIKLLRAVSTASGHRHLVLICSGLRPDLLALFKGIGANLEPGGKRL